MRFALSASFPRSVPVCLVVGLVLAFTAPALGGVTDDPEGCCEVTGGCTELRLSQCNEANGKFFADSACSSGPSRDCVVVHAVEAGARFQLRLVRDGESPLTGPVSVGGETEVARSGGSGDATIPIEIVNLELAGNTSTFGPVTLRYLEPEPPTLEGDLDTGFFSGLLDRGGWELIHHSDPSLEDSATQVSEIAEPVSLNAAGVFSFPPLGSTFSSPSGSVVPLVSGGEVVGEIRDFELTFGGTEAPDCCAAAAPGASLLVPYFEVDLGDVNGANTLVSLGNTEEGCTLARVTLWTDLGVPTLTFWVNLSPGDVQTLSLRDLLAGSLPDTSGVLGDPQCPVLDFDPCQASELAPSLGAGQVAALRAAHTGAPDPVNGLCSGLDRGDDVARGYLTADVVHACAFAPTVATHQRADELFDPFALGSANRLWGDYIYAFEGENFAQSEEAVHRAHDPFAFDPGDHTFYGRYVAWDGSDGRPPLPSRYRVRYLQGGPFDGGTRLIVWRDNLSADTSPRPCGTPASWQPLGEAGVMAWDEAESSTPVGALADVCPGAAGVSFACDLQDLPYPFGYLELDLAHADGTPAQAEVVGVLRARGRFSVGNRAVADNDLCEEDAPPPFIEPAEDFTSIYSCGYEVLGTSGTQCPFSFGDTLYIECRGGCPVGNQDIVSLCPQGLDCDLPLRLVDPSCEPRQEGARFRVVNDCGAP